MKKLGFGIRSAAQHVTVLNVLLLCAFVVFSNYIAFPLLKINISYKLPVRNKMKMADNVISPPKIDLPSLQDFTIVADNNLFHPERIIPPEKKEEESSLPKPDFVLYGTLIADTVKIAYLEDLKDPKYTPSRGKRQIPLKKDDVLSGFTLKEVDADRVVLVRGDEKIIVSVSDSHRRARSDASLRKENLPGTAPGQPSSLSNQQPPLPIQRIKRERPASQKRVDQEVFDFFQKRSGN